MTKKTGISERERRKVEGRRDAGGKRVSRWGTTTSLDLNTRIINKKKKKKKVTL